MKETKSNYCEHCGEFHDRVQDHVSLVRVGESIPDFEFEAYVARKVETMTLSSFRGKWLILFFYEADFSVVCPTELSELATRSKEFEALGAEILSISTDTVYAHKAWHSSDERIGKINFPMAADPSGKISYAFGVLSEGGETLLTNDEGLAQRGTFIIDPMGVLRAMEVSDSAIGRSATETLRKLQAAQFTEAHQGLVCGAAWQPGEEGIEAAAA